MPPAIPVLGQALGPYRLLAGIALGGRAAVFRGRDERSQRPVAVKVPIEGALAGDEARDRLRWEALALGRLDHPGIAALLDTGSEAGIDFLVLEYVEGPTLAARLRGNGPLEEAALLPIACQVAAALEEAHRRGVVHGDLKPGNIALAPCGAVKILDFGQAHLEGEPPRKDEATLPYMAPERLQRKRPDPRSDLWSLGVLLYELATGRRPFRGSTSEETVRSILEETPAPPSAHAPRLSALFDRLVLRALEKDPDRRHPSAGAMVVRATG